jgi:hypothetical protein
LRERQLQADLLKSEIEEGTYKSRVQSIKGYFTEVQNLINQIAPQEVIITKEEPS